MLIMDKLKKNDKKTENQQENEDLSRDRFLNDTVEFLNKIKKEKNINTVFVNEEEFVS